MNRMEKLLDKIERRLGTRVLNLPDHLTKDKWASDVIANDTLDSFSRYFPDSTIYVLDSGKTPQKNGWYLLDANTLPPGTEFIGVSDINWDLFATGGIGHGSRYGIYDYTNTSYGIDEVMLLQGRADLTSMFNNQIMCEFREPNLVRVYNVLGGDLSAGIRLIPINILIKHNINLMTISQTMMETFERLAVADVAGFLYEELKYYGEAETVYANIDLKLSDFQDKYSRRDDIIEELASASVSAANKSQPLMFTV